MKRQLPIIFSFLAVILASYAVVQSRSTHQARITPIAPTASSLSEKAVGVSKPRSAVIPTVVNSDSDEALTLVSAALNDIQGRLARMEGKLGMMQSGWEGLARRGLVPLTPEQESELLRQVMDPTAEVRDRLAAMQLLRRHGKLNDPALTSMVQLAQFSEDPNIRRQIYGAMDGLTNAVIMPALVAALSTEKDARAREEAADSLSGFVGDPKVQEQLRNAAENDPDPRVRREAQEALKDRFNDMPSDQLKVAAMDPNLSAYEKLAALGQLRESDAEARTPEVVASMVDLYLSSQDPGVKADIFRQLDGVSDPILKIPLLDGLANDPNPRVREEAADSLSGYVSDPIVVEWLRYTAANDADARVRREATSVLKAAGLL